MSEPFRNWLGMGVTIPARIQPGSIDHVPFPLVLGRLWLYERKPAIKVFLFSSWIIFRCVHRRGNRNASFSAGVAWSGSVAWVRLTLSLNCLSCAREGPPVPRQHLEVGVHYGRISHPGKPTLLQEELCYAPPIPIERKSCLVIPRLQHVRSLTPRAAAAVSRTDRRLTCTASLAAAKGLDVLPCYGSLRSEPGAALGSDAEGPASVEAAATAAKSEELSGAGGGLNPPFMPPNPPFPPNFLFNLPHRASLHYVERTILGLDTPIAKGTASRSGREANVPSDTTAHGQASDLHLPQVPSVSFSSGGRGSLVLLAFLHVVALAYRRVLQYIQHFL
uniref:Uncharacterized protein n=1 Tax=Ammopiptanthus mongolicus TaxID=126911 RepID=A0A385G2A5_AMMMO|nr:hypothetical protein [Ammopiptanthus mongolicus]AXV54326.1 hypothetical protein [Ammopiptanthus mongolicus]